MHIILEQNRRSIDRLYPLMDQLTDVVSELGERGDLVEELRDVVANARNSREGCELADQ